MKDKLLYLVVTAVLACQFATGADPIRAVELRQYSILVDAVVDPEVNRCGTEVVFIGYGNPWPRIYIYELETGALNNITTAHLYVPAHPTWSPDGNQVAFQAYGQPTNTQDIWLVDADGSTPPIQIITTGFHDQTPTWSPDGSRIAFSSGPHNEEDVWIKELDSPDPPVALDVSGKPASRLDWTNQNTILYRGRSDGLAIWEVSVLSGEVVEAVPGSLYPGSQDMLSAATTDQGDRIAVPIAAGVNGSSPYELWLLVRQGVFERIVGADDVGWDALSPSWTSTGDSLFFAANGTLYLATDLPDGTVATSPSTWGSVKGKYEGEK